MEVRRAIRRAALGVICALVFIPSSATAEPISPAALEAAMNQAPPPARKNPLVSVPDTVRQRNTKNQSIEMPWIWKELKRSAYSRLPKKQIDGVQATLAPTMVSSGFDTVPGAGLQGRF